VAVGYFFLFLLHADSNLSLFFLCLPRSRLNCFPCQKIRFDAVVYTLHCDDERAAERDMPFLWKKKLHGRAAFVHVLCMGRVCANIHPLLF
jgi:hypothetical protein